MQPSTADRVATAVVPAMTIIDDGNMRLLRALPQKGQAAIGPFVFIDHYRHQGLHGIGDRPHPHAGIEVVSYLLAGSAEHRDSMGFRDRLGPGDAQFIRAGRGMLHAEQPLEGRHGLQLWASLPPDQKTVEPSYASFPAADIPVTGGAGWRLYVVAGRVTGRDGPMPLSCSAVFARLRLEAGAAAALEIEPSLQIGVYVIEGSASVGDVNLVLGDLARMDGGDRLRLAAVGDTPVEIVIIGGAPVQGEVLFSGPFVMDTPERLAQAKRDYGAGRMGRMG